MNAGSDRALAINTAAASLPSGRYAVAVSGGADSVALLILLAESRSHHLHVVHLDHETRAGQSGEDARFVAELSARLGVTCTIALRSEVETTCTELPHNRSARYRAARLALFRRVVEEHSLDAVLLAHHRDDLAETIFQRLLRGATYRGLTGLREVTRVDGIRLVRPLLRCARSDLRAFLISRGQTWREDSSNVRDDQQRNQVRKLLAIHPATIDPLIALGDAAELLRDWTETHSPELPERFRTEAVARIPALLRDESVRQWLTALGLSGRVIERDWIERLVRMSIDATSTRELQFSAAVKVKRKAGFIEGR